jgi:uncharacterized LabA/DUF88 family protein
MKHDLPSFAVLIDADNVRLDSISSILEEVTRHARVTVRRIYGDFTSQNLAGWKVKLADHAIHPIQQYRNTNGKNASDSALIIDAMDLLHSRRFEGFCLVSSDSDFTRLATRIREDGLVVYGFGEKKTPKAFVNACDRYIYVENLLDTALSEQGVEDKKEEMACTQEGIEQASQNEQPDDYPPQDAASDQKISPAPSPSQSIAKASPPSATYLLQRAFSNVADEQGWAMLEQLSSYIHANHSDFDPRTYGCAKFIDLIRKAETFELIQRPYKNGQSYFCRPKDTSSPSLTKAQPDRSVSSQAYRAALVKAVTQAAAANGWAPISTIGQKLKALGRTIKESGRSTLTEALKATSLFEMQGKGAARYFRLKP